MSIVTAIIVCLRKTADFSGRARRLEFWSFVVFWIAAAVLSALVFKAPAAPLRLGKDNLSPLSLHF